MIPAFYKFFGILLFQRNSRYYALTVAIGLGFSMAVILSSIGLMDGFEKTLKMGLRSSSGDIFLRSRWGFFDFNESIKNVLDNNDVTTSVSIIESEGFSLYKEKTKGVLIRGVGKEYFESILHRPLHLQSGTVAIGYELALFYGIEKGQNLILSIIGNSRDMGDLPALKEFTVGGIIQHGIYQKDLRYVYMNKKELQEILSAGDRVNGVLLKTSKEDINPIVDNLNEELGEYLYISPFWSEFSILLKAIKVEKFMIGLILQIIVIIAVFNVLAYIFFLSETRSKEIFLFCTLGMSQRKLLCSWGLFVGILWAVSCFFSFVFYYVIKYLIENIEFLALPSDVYYLTNLKLSLSSDNYFFVFMLSLIWMMAVTFFNLKHLNKNELIQCLRQEFT